MLQELSEELKNVLGQSITSKLKSYGQFEFEGNIIIVEYLQHLWFQAKLMIVHQYYIPKSSSLYSIKESPNFQDFLSQIEAFKVTQDNDSFTVSILVDLKHDYSLKKDTFVEQLIKLKTEKPHELRNVISNSMNKYQKHYANIINNMPFNNKIEDVFQSDQAVIFLAKNSLQVHEDQKLPHIKIEQKVYFKQPKCEEKIEFNQVSSNIFSQLQKQNKAEQFQLESIINSIQTYKYFTFYQHKFLLVYYTTFLKVLEEKQEGVLIHKIDDTIINQSALFAVTQQNEHILINIEGDNMQSYPQMTHLLGKQLVNIMETDQFMEIFTETIVHENIKPNIDVYELSNKFKMGSVLLVRTKLFTNQACVYLGSDLVITVILDHNNEEQIQKNNLEQKPLSDEQAQMKENQMETEEQKQKDEENHIFQFSRFEQFYQEEKTIQEIRFKFQPYDKQELFEKALQMNKSSFQFNIYKQNSEHLAFELASGFRFSPQQKHLINKIGAVVQNIFFSK
ncbi:hypothetical protein ABPG74_002286 [Tetrahymena malaccensis]